MSRTNSKQVMSRVHRSLKGNRHKKMRLLSEDDVPVRKGAVPPNPYEDKQISNEHCRWFDMLDRFLDDKTLSHDEVIKRMTKRFPEVSVGRVHFEIHKRTLRKSSR
jgi:hypothetical protein